MTTRRDILIGSGAIAAASTLPAPAVLGQAKPRVVVIGGGAGGATAAKYIAKDSEKKIAVTLIEENPNYQTCFHSNLFLGGFRDYKSILHDYAKLQGHGVDIARARAQVIDRDKKQVVLADGRRIAYDRWLSRPASTSNTIPSPAGARNTKSACRTPGSRARRPAS